MKTLYLDIFSGISGDMLIAALIDLGVDAALLETELKKLRLDGWHLHVARAEKSNLSGVKFDVHLADDHQHDAHSHEPEHQHAHAHAGGETHSHPHSHDDGHDHGFLQQAFDQNQPSGGRSLS